MTARLVFPSAGAQRDVADALSHYIEQAGRDVARDFVTALETAYARIAAAPAQGSPRYGNQLNIPDLRHLTLKRFPYLVFYVEQEDRIEVWRVLHARRDIPAWLAEDAP